MLVDRWIRTSTITEMAIIGGRFNMKISFNNWFQDNLVIIIIMGIPVLLRQHRGPFYKLIFYSEDKTPPKMVDHIISLGSPGPVFDGIAACSGIFGTMVYKCSTGPVVGLRHPEPLINAFASILHITGCLLTVHKIWGMCAGCPQSPPQVSLKIRDLSQCKRYNAF